MNQLVPLVSKGTPVVFYESGKSNGRSAAVAEARVTSTVIVPKSQITATLIDGGVVAEEDIKDLSSGVLIAATTVDNVMKLRKPVALKHLREFVNSVASIDLISSLPGIYRRTNCNES